MTSYAQAVARGRSPEMPSSCMFQNGEGPYSRVWFRSLAVFGVIWAVPKAWDLVCVCFRLIVGSYWVLLDMRGSVVPLLLHSVV